MRRFAYYRPADQPMVRPVFMGVDYATVETRVNASRAAALRRAHRGFKRAKHDDWERLFAEDKVVGAHEALARQVPDLTPATIAFDVCAMARHWYAADGAHWEQPIFAFIAVVDRLVRRGWVVIWTDVEHNYTMSLLHPDVSVTSLIDALMVLEHAESMNSNVNTDSVHLHYGPGPVPPGHVRGF